MTALKRDQWQRRDLPRDFRGSASAEKVETVSVRMDGDKMQALEGYGAVFYRADAPGTEFWLWDDLVERLMPGCFDETVAKDDIRSFFNHDANQILGRRQFSDGDTLRLSVDDFGLRYSVPFDEDPTQVSVFSKVRSGKVTGSSFMFVPTAETYRFEEDPTTKKRIEIIEVTATRTFELGPVVFPAYEASTSEVRRRMADEFTVLEREARERRAAAGIGQDKLRRFRHRVAVSAALSRLKFPTSAAGKPAG